MLDSGCTFALRFKAATMLFTDEPALSSNRPTVAHADASINQVMSAKFATRGVAQPCCTEVDHDKLCMNLCSLQKLIEDNSAHSEQTPKSKARR